MGDMKRALASAGNLSRVMTGLTQTRLMLNMCYRPTLLVLPYISQPMTMVDLIKESYQVQMVGKSNYHRQKSNGLALQPVGFYLIWFAQLTN